MQPIFKSEVLIYESNASLHVKLLFGKVTHLLDSITNKILEMGRQTTSVSVSASFIALDAATALHMGLIIKLTENPANFAAKMAPPIRSQDLLLVI